ncbi:MAG: pyridoxamine 5'-phosphate oxidase [Pseudomonadota bacterium]
MNQVEDRTGIFAGTDPFEILRGWLDDAAGTEPNDPNAMQLATVDSDGMPNVRTVLLKDILSDALVFYTNYESTKAGELDGAGKAAVVLHWKSLRRQVRARGAVERFDGPEADAYYASRSLESRIGAWASPQSQPLASRADLEARVAEMRARHGDAPQRPPYWGGFALRAETFEFWADGAHRLHDRFAWRRDAGAWRITRLAP